MKAKEIAQNIDWTQACCKPMGKEQDLWDTEMSLKLEQQIIEYAKQEKDQVLKEICKEIEKGECKECNQMAGKHEHGGIHAESICDANRQAYRDLEIIKKRITKKHE